jgi:hypothetical protein
MVTGEIRVLLKPNLPPGKVLLARDELLGLGWASAGYDDTSMTFLQDFAHVDDIQKAADEAQSAIGREKGVISWCEADGSSLRTIDG